MRHLINKKNICFLDALVNSLDMYIIAGFMKIRSAYYRTCASRHQVLMLEQLHMLNLR